MFGRKKEIKDNPISQLPNFDQDLDDGDIIMDAFKNNAALQPQVQQQQYQQPNQYQQPVQQIQQPVMQSPQVQQIQPQIQQQPQQPVQFQQYQQPNHYQQPVQQIQQPTSNSIITKAEIDEANKCYVYVVISNLPYKLGYCNLVQ